MSRQRRELDIGKVWFILDREWLVPRRIVLREKQQRRTPCRFDSRRVHSKPTTATACQAAATDDRSLVHPDLLIGRLNGSFTPKPIALPLPFPAPLLRKRACE
jgi:hypothetical protein